MKILICGAGEVGSHAAEVLGAGAASITVIDRDADRLRSIEDTMDVATFRGNCADAEVLAAAGARDADLVVGATDQDEVNLLTAAVAKGLGTRKTIARVHHIAYFDPAGFQYQDHFGIDRLICPEYSTSLAIARTLRNPGALAIEGFGRGRIEMQEFAVSRKAPAVGKPLVDLPLPKGVRLAVVTRKEGSFIPEASTVIQQGDTVILVGNVDVFQEARRLFHDGHDERQRVVLMGGTAMSVWLARSLRDRNFAIRVFEMDRPRAEELAEKLPWVTVLQSDPTDRGVFDDEHLAEADVFVGLLDDDEANIIGGVLAKLRGVPRVIAVVQKSKFLDLIYDIGVDQAFSPRIVAAREIQTVLDEGSLRHLGSLAAGVVDVFSVRVGDDAPILDRPLREIRLSPGWVVAAVQRNRTSHVPSADDTITRGDTVLVVGRQGEEQALRKLFGAR